MVWLRQSGVRGVSHIDGGSHNGVKHRHETKSPCVISSLSSFGSDQCWCSGSDTWFALRPPRNQVSEPKGTRATQ